MTTQLPTEQNNSPEVLEERPWWRRWWMIALYVMVAVLVFGGVALMATPESDDPADAYVGTWISMERKYLEFRDDGTYLKAHRQSLLQTTPFETGSFTFDGETLRINTSEDSAECLGIDAVYEAEPSGDGNFIAHTLINDDCAKRAADFSKGITRVDQLEG